MLNLTVRRWGMSFCLAAGLPTYLFSLGLIEREQIIWLLLLFWPVIGFFGEWQFRLGQRVTANASVAQSDSPH
jgi:hypothetical protein